jgi:hypothetical protein
MDWSVSAELAEKNFEFGDGELLYVKQVKLNIFGNEFFLDPDQAHNLTLEISQALYEIEGK